MATLNQTETESLRAVQSKIGGVRRRLQDEKPITDQDRILMQQMLKDADDRVKTVITMKGYYGK